ncbi:MAG: hypothetical protein J2P28_05000, partial [Actinobacteria bacterium]|nr:hypothetical protein [Actinomycetota bacterium]
LDSGRVAGLEQSVTRHARRITQQLIDEVALAQRAARLPGEQAGAQVAAFAARLAAVTRERQDAQDRAAAQSGRLLEALNVAAGQARPQLTADIGEAMTSLLAGELASVSSARLERAGRDRLTRMVADAVEAWRQQQADQLEDGLRELDRRLAGELEADLATVRSAAADLLGVDLAPLTPDERLAPDLGFFYNLGEQVDQIELLAGAIRRRLPGEYGRRLARQRLLAEIGDLVDAQLGRARGDLQYRLAEATRRLLADVQRSYADWAHRLAAALDRADRIRAESGEQRDLRLAELGDRALALDAVMGQLAAETVSP